MLPNVIILGAPKAGTTSTHMWLTDHPDVAGPKVKETEYFVDKNSHAYNPDSNYHNQGVAGYERFFESNGPSVPRVVMEAGPDYMYQQIALQKLPELPNEPTFIFLLREPASQIYSLFQYLQNNWQYLPNTMTFSEFIELARVRSETLAHHELLQNAIDNARYLAHIEKWVARVGQDRVRVYLFDDLKRDSQQYMQRLCADLGLDPSFYDSYDFDKGNESYRIRSHALQKLNLAVRSKLPHWTLYNWARRVYRRLNTDPDSIQKSTEELETLRTLRLEFAAANNALAERFQLDLRDWQIGALQDQL
ncbi:MAG: sulfotransferase [Pseudomonadales bacterium]